MSDDTDDFGDNPVDDFLRRKSPTLGEEWLTNKGYTYITSDDKRFDDLEDARDHQGDLNREEMDDD